MSMRTEINQSPSGEVTVVTTNKPYPYKGKMTSSTYVYPSAEACRKDLVREKFCTDTIEQSRGLSSAIVIISSLTLAADKFLPGHPIPEDPFAVTILCSVALGLVLLYTKRTHEETDSRVLSFNVTFPPNLKPVTFSPREYFSTLKIPFLHRRPRIT